VSTIRATRGAQASEAIVPDGERSPISIQPGTPIETPAMRLSEVARRLAISRAGAYRLVRSGELPGIHVGQTWRVLRSDFDAYVAEQRAAAERRYRAAQGKG
jgi:excisionase family DNA binding protein